VNMQLECPGKTKGGLEGSARQSLCSRKVQEKGSSEQGPGNCGLEPFRWPSPRKPETEKKEHKDEKHPPPTRIEKFLLESRKRSEQQDLAASTQGRGVV